MTSINCIIDENHGSNDSIRELPGPHLVARMIRKAVYPIKQIGTRIKYTITSLRRYAGGQNSLPPVSELEKGGPELEKQETSADINRDSTSHSSHGKTQFRRSIEETFNSSAFTNAILNAIEDYETSPEILTDSEYDPELRLRRRLHILLWGYPELTTLFNDSWYPYLSPIHRIKRLEPNEIQHFLTYSSADGSRDTRIRKVKYGHQVVALKIFRDGYLNRHSSMNVSTSSSLV